MELRGYPKGNVDGLNSIGEPRARRRRRHGRRSSSRKTVVQTGRGGRPPKDHLFLERHSGMIRGSKRRLKNRRQLVQKNTTSTKD